MLGAWVVGVGRELRTLLNVGNPWGREWLGPVLLGSVPVADSGWGAVKAWLKWRWLEGCLGVGRIVTYYEESPHLLCRVRCSVL
jgi:hypothetical protein